MPDPATEKMYKTIGENIYKFRVLEHMSQERLAAKSDISTAYVSQIECFRLHKGVTCTTMIKIAQALDVPLCVLMTETPCQKYLQCIEQAASVKNSGR